MNYINDFALLTNEKKKKFDIELYRNQIANIKNTWICKKPIAHRGYHNDKIVENTLESYRQAIRRGYGIEIDVRKCKDGTLVVCHDSNLKRLLGVDASISSLTYDEIKQHKLIGSNETIPTFDDVLNCVRGRTPLLIEIKSFAMNGKIETQVYERLQQYKGKYAIQSFNPYTVAWYKNNAPEVMRGQLISSFKNIPIPGKYFLSKMLTNKITMPHFISSDSTIGNKALQNTHGKAVLAWTVTTKEEYDKVIKYCDNVIFEHFNPFGHFGFHF